MMATTLSSINGSIRQKPFALSLTPVNFSLTAGTDIPAPPESPAKGPPTPGGGPLTSHPTTPERKIPGAYPVSENSLELGSPQQKPVDSATATPVMDHSPSTQRPRRPSTVRKMFSLSNLRTSFSGSRTSLALNRPSVDRPSLSTYDRPYTPTSSSVTSSSPTQDKLSLRRKRSGGNWFKRKSSLLFMNQSVDDPSTLDSHGNKRLRSAYSLPMLPEISELAGGDIGDGDLGWDSTVFKRY